MRLAESCCTPYVDALEATLTPSQLAEWVAFWWRRGGSWCDRVRRGDAVVASVVANCNGNKTKPEDWLPSDAPEATGQRQTLDEMKAALAAHRSRPTI